MLFSLKTWRSLLLGHVYLLALSKKIETSIGLGIAVVIVMAIIVPANNLINTYLLKEGSWLG